MAEYATITANWKRLASGLPYKWIVDYASYNAFGNFELSSEDWEKRDYIVNFKGNSELTTEIDHQAALQKTIGMVSELLKKVFGNEAQQLTLACVPASLQAHTERRFKEFSQKVCEETGMQNAYSAFSYTHQTDEDGDQIDTLHIDPNFFKGKKAVIFDDIIASGGSVAKFADQLKQLGAEIVAAIALGKKISDGYDQNT